MVYNTKHILSVSGSFMLQSMSKCHKSSKTLRALLVVGTKKCQRCTETHTHTTVLRLSVFCPGLLGLVGTKKKTFTLSWWSIILYMLLPSIANHGTPPVQFMCLTVFLHNLCPSFLWSTSWSGTL